MKEIWKDIPEYEGLYQISNYGKVMSLNYNHTKQNRELLTNENTDGYLSVALCKNNKIKRYRINRLVAQAFIPNPNNKPQVNHIDGNKKNNFISNLEWCTASENQIHSYKNGLHKILKGEMSHRYGLLGSLNPTSKKVAQYDIDNNLIKIWDSLSDVARTMKKSISSISLCCNGHHKTSCGYIWRFYK